MIRLVIFSIFVLSLFACSTNPERSLSSTKEKILPGEFFKVLIPFPKDEVLDDITMNLKDTHPRQLSEIKLKGVGQRFQQEARILGLDFCLSQGYSHVAAVFWRGRSLSAAHCIDSSVSRQAIMSKSYGVGCKILGNRSYDCRRLGNKFKEYSVDLHELPIEN